MFKERIKTVKNPAAKKLMTLVDEKKSSLCLSLDVTKKKELFHFAETLGPEIALLKTHVDILQDFDPSVIQTLVKIAKKHHFLLFEDRKFADIGNTSLLQYEKGIYQISSWADITNCHILPGPGIIEALQKVGLPKERGLLLLAEMSSEGALTDVAYQKKALAMANTYSDFVIGFITQTKISQNPAHLHFTPGVKLEPGKDSLGQQYTTVTKAIEKGADIIIVGRGILESKDPINTAKAYRAQAQEALEKRR